MLTESRVHVVVIDMQRDFLDDKPPQKVALAKAAIGHVVTNARKRGFSVTYTMFPEKKYGPLDNDLKCQTPQEIVVKNDNDAFAEEEFVERVTGAKALLVMGCNLEFCVLATVASAVKRGIFVRVYKDAILSRDKRSLRLFAAILALKLSPNTDYS